MTVHPVVGRRWLFELKPQVVFTADGRKPIDSKPKMARLRKSFCKNWWNDQWRMLLNAYVRFLADEDGIIRIPLGGSAELTLAGELMAFEAPTRIVGDSISPAEADAIETETAADTLDDGDDRPDLDDLGEEEG